MDIIVSKIIEGQPNFKLNDRVNCTYLSEYIRSKLSKLKPVQNQNPILNSNKFTIPKNVFVKETADSIIISDSNNKAAVLDLNLNSVLEYIMMINTASQQDSTALIYGEEYNGSFSLKKNKTKIAEYSNMSETIFLLGLLKNNSIFSILYDFAAFREGKPSSLQYVPSQEISAKTLAELALVCTFDLPNSNQKIYPQGDTNKRLPVIEDKDYSKRIKPLISDQQSISLFRFDK